MNLVGIPIGPQPETTASGVQLWPLELDEATIVTAYRIVRDQGAGSLALELKDGAVIRWDVRPTISNAATLSELIRRKRPLRD